MSVQEGTKRLKTWKGSYDFAVDGGAAGAITLRSDDGPLPDNAIVVSGVLDVTTACLSATGTMALAAEGAADVLAATAQAGLTVGRKDIIPDGTGSTALKTTQARGPTVTIATAAFTAGVFDLYLFYV